ncbi:MAG TPA: DUF455 family protein, partial [Solimonas sp.]|nr:DUF455 family protein [Solimonas sp.]
MNAAFAAVHAALAECDPAAKGELVLALSFPDGDFAVPDCSEDPAAIPGRPARPTLVHPREVPHRGLGSAEGRAALIHAVAHIEFNAINLA